MNNVDPDGQWAWAASLFFVPVVGEFLAVATITFVAIVATIELGRTIGEAYGRYEARKQEQGQGPVGKVNRKKQGRETNYKARKKDWVDRSNKDPNRPMKRHTPGRDHKKKGKKW